MADEQKPRCFTGWNTCPVCGKLFYVPTSEWVYRHTITKADGYYEVKYFHTWSCFKKFEDEYDLKLREKRANAAIKAAKSRKATMNKKFAGKHCEDCDRCAKGRYGFYDCLYFGWAVSKTKNACRMFRQREET